MSKQIIFTTSTMTRKPAGKKGIIPPNCLGDILQIWNFFNSFADLFKFEDIQKEEIYVALKYDGDQNILLVNDMHQGLLSLFLQEFVRKNKFELQRDEQDFPFFVILKYHLGETVPDADDLALIWTEFARHLLRIPDYKHMFTQISKRNFEILAQKTALNYNKIDYKIKIKILLDLLECVYETDEFHEFLHSKLEDNTNLVKEKNELLQEIKQEEGELNDLKSKIEQETNKQKENESITQYMSRTESLKKQKENEQEKKEVQKHMNNIAKIEASINKKLDRIEKISSETSTNNQSSTLIGLDFNKNEYWYFLHDPNRIYVRYAANQMAEETEDTWYYYDKQEEIDQLIKSLNPRGIREKALQENLTSMMKNKQINFNEEDLPSGNLEKKDKDKESKDKEKQTGANLHSPNNEMLIEGKPSDVPLISKENMSNHQSTKTTSSENIEYWLKKIFEYQMDPNSNNDLLKENTTALRTTRRKARLRELSKKQEEQKHPPKDIKSLELGLIKQMVFDIEVVLSDYLKSWNSRWARPKIKEEMKNRIIKCEKIEEFAEILLRLNEKFSSCESLNKILSTTVIEKPKEEIKPIYNEDDEEFFDDEDGKKSEEPQPPVSSIDEDDENIRYKKINLRLWGLSNEKLKKCWLNLIPTIDNLAGLYFVTYIFCDIVQKYVTKKKTHYFSGKEVIIPSKSAQNPYDNRTNNINKEEKRHKKISLKATGTAHSKYDHHKSEYNNKPTSIDNFEKYKFSTRSQTRAQTSSAANNNNNNNNNNTYQKPQPDYRDSEDSGDEIDDSFEYKYISNNEKTRYRQERLNELVTRRSERNIAKLAKKKIIYDEKDVDCKRCGDNDNVILKCTMCESNYHLECVGLKGMPEGVWHCVDCLEKIASQRQTRSSARRLII